jgi:OTU domain-containing protein 6
MPQINADGHCLYSAVADQLALLSILSPEQATHVTTRLAASTYIWNHPNDFLPFLSEESPGTAAGPMSPQSFEQYCARIRDTSVWGGEPEILALSRAFNVPIHVVQWGSPPVVVHNPIGAPTESDAMDKSRKVVRISYHRRMYGLGEVNSTISVISRLAVNCHIPSITIRYVQLQRENS